MQFAFPPPLDWTPALPPGRAVLFPPGLPPQAVPVVGLLFDTGPDAQAAAGAVLSRPGFGVELLDYSSEFVAFCLVAYHGESYGPLAHAARAELAGLTGRPARGNWPGLRGPVLILYRQAAPEAH